MIRVLVADDHPVVREGLRRIIDECPDLKLVGQATDGEETLSLAERTPSDVLLLDVCMRGPGLEETLRLLNETCPGLRILVLSVEPEERFALRSLQAGASGYLSKDLSSRELTDAIRCVASGRRYLTDRVAEQLASRLVEGERHLPHEQLSPRELAVFKRLAAGRSVGEIASEFGLSPKTVSTYRARILEKTGFTNNAHIVRYALEHDFLDEKA